MQHAGLLTLETPTFLAAATPMFKSDCLNSDKHDHYSKSYFAGSYQLADFLTAGRSNVSDGKMTIPVILTAYPSHNSTAVRAVNSTTRDLLQDIPQSNAQGTTCGN